MSACDNATQFQHISSLVLRTSPTTTIDFGTHCTHSSSSMLDIQKRSMLSPSHSPYMCGYRAIALLGLDHGMCDQERRWGMKELGNGLETPSSTVTESGQLKNIT